MKQFGWNMHDGEMFAHTEVLDEYASMTVTWVKRPVGVNGGEWVVSFALV